MKSLHLHFNFEDRVSSQEVEAWHAALKRAADQFCHDNFGVCPVTNVWYQIDNRPDKQAVSTGHLGAEHYG